MTQWAEHHWGSVLLGHHAVESKKVGVFLLQPHVSLAQPASRDVCSLALLSEKALGEMQTLDQETQSCQGCGVPRGCLWGPR